MKYVGIGIVSLLIFLFGTWAGFTYSQEHTNQGNLAICRRVNVLDSALISILDRSFKGLPSNPYYKAHPQELAKALASTQAAIDDLERARC